MYRCDISKRYDAGFILRKPGGRALPRAVVPTNRAKEAPASVACPLLGVDERQVARVDGNPTVNLADWLASDIIWCST
jgi:hypothetical protein